MPSIPAEQISEICSKIVEIFTQSTQIESLGKQGVFVGKYRIYQDDDMVWHAVIPNLPASLQNAKTSFHNRDYFFLLQDVFKHLAEDAVTFADAAIQTDIDDSDFNY